MARELELHSPRGCEFMTKSSCNGLLRKLYVVYEHMARELQNVGETLSPHWELVVFHGFPGTIKAIQRELRGIVSLPQNTDGNGVDVLTIQRENDGDAQRVQEAVANLRRRLGYLVRVQAVVRAE